MTVMKSQLILFIEAVMGEDSELIGKMFFYTKISWHLNNMCLNYQGPLIHGFYFSWNTYYNTALYLVDWICGYRTMDTECSKQS